MAARKKSVPYTEQEEENSVSLALEAYQLMIGENPDDIMVKTEMDRTANRFRRTKDCC